MKILLVIIDGLGDKPIPELGNKTPLEAAETPNLDWLAENGVCGLILPWHKKNDIPHSDTAHLALFGYNPKKYYLGRGVYEAAGIGVGLKKEDVALRVNFATVDSDLKVIDRRAGRIEKTESLIRALQGKEFEGVKFIIEKSFGHRAVLILRGKNLSAKISDGDPHRVGVKVKKIRALNKSKQAKFTAEVLNKFLFEAHQVLKKHFLNKKRNNKGQLAANYLLVRGAGQFRRTLSFKQKYKLKSACIAGGKLYKGIGRILGMNLIKVKSANGFVNTNLKGKFLAARNSLKKYDFVFLHIKAADNLAEDGNFQGKKEFIEKIDKNLKPILNIKNVLVVITGDHSTCCGLKRHCLEPVPILIFGNGKDLVKKFSERDCKKGKLRKINQLNLMSEMLKLVYMA